MLVNVLHASGNIRTFTRLHHKRQARIDAVGSLLGLLWCHLCALLSVYK